GATVRTATLRQDADHGLSQEVIDATDVLFWWGHVAHAEVSDEVVQRVQQAVLGGMGLIVLHSGHNARVFHRLMGTNCSLKWREADEKERIWNIAPGHPVMHGVPEYFELAQEEMYGERFDVPEPDELLALSWFQGGEVFRSLATWKRGHGTVIYFRPGHETYPTYHDANVQTILANAALYAAPRFRRSTAGCPMTEPLESVPNWGKEHVLNTGSK
ncbi:MAG: ThuA domain-containing protein, partial [Trueperaceae bacterium]